MTKNQLRNVKPQTVIRVLIYLFLPPILLFGGAGTLKWGMGWVYLILTMGGVILSRILVARVHPDLLAERAASLEAEGVPAWDKKLVPMVSTVTPLFIMLVAGLDKRFGWSPPFASWVLLLGTAVVAAAVSLVIWAMTVNRYFSAFVRLQSERGQQVVSHGPYAFVRHPGYTAGILTNIGTALMLGSWWVLVPSMLGIMFIVIRTHLEDRFLQNQLIGYIAYTEKVRWKLLPFIW